jgi:tRNA-specific 2-thiouridylase
MLAFVTARSRVLIAMSGGVDSSVAAARLVDAGLDVVGVTLHLWDYPDDSPPKSRCCAPEDIHDAKLVASHLGIPHYAFDRRELFETRVVAPFVEAYLEGRTPSPCVACNRWIKVPELMGIADRLGADTVATGHYARVVADGDSQPRLYRGRDTLKDQSYFLYMLSQSLLRRLRLPLGESHKSEVRAEAKRRGLPAADKGESQELCFVAADGYARFVEQRAPSRIRPGAIEDDDGQRVGSHEGIHRYTRGQRRVLGIAMGHPALVTYIAAASNVVRVGSAEQASASRARLAGTTWNDDVVFPLRAKLKVRSQHEGTMAMLEQDVDEGDERGVVAQFEQAVRGVSPGQVAVAFDGDRVVGGGIIVSAWTEEPA